MALRPSLSTGLPLSWNPKPLSAAPLLSRHQIIRTVNGGVISDASGWLFVASRPADTAKLGQFSGAVKPAKGIFRNVLASLSRPRELRRGRQDRPWM